MRNFSWCQTGLYKIRSKQYLSLCVMRNFNLCALVFIDRKNGFTPKKLRKQKKRSYPEWSRFLHDRISQNPHRARGFVKSPLLDSLFQNQAHFDCPHVGVFPLADAGPWMELSLSGNLDCSACSVLATRPTGSVTWVLRKRRDLTEIQVKCQQCPCPSLSHCLHLKSISHWGHLGAKLLTTLDGPPRQNVLFKYLHDILSFACWPAKP